MRLADAGYLQTLENVRANILAYQQAILSHDVRLEPTPGIELGVRYVPLRRVGVCIPGGAAAYPSTLLMTVVPAQAAGVAEIAVVAPPTRFGAYNTNRAGGLPCPGCDRGLPHRRGPGRRRAGVRCSGYSGRGQDRRPGQPLRRTCQEAGLRRGRYRQHRRSQRGRPDRR